MLENIKNIDFLVLNFIRDNFSNDFLDFLMPKITVLGNGGAIWIIATIVLLMIPKYRKGGKAMLAGLVAVLIIGNITLKPLIGRVRPYDLIDGIELLIAAPSDYSFPSGHTLSSFVAAFILSMIDKRFAYIAIPLAVLIAFSRLYLYVHFPSDVLGGIIIAALISAVVYLIFFKKKSSH